MKRRNYSNNKDALGGFCKGYSSSSNSGTQSKDELNKKASDKSNSEQQTKK